MQTLLWTLIIIATLGAASYFRMKLMNATIAVAIAMLLGSIFGPVGGIAWLVFLIIAIPLNVESLRKKYLTAPILDTYKKIMPEMSSTERDAIDAGTRVAIIISVHNNVCIKTPDIEVRPECQSSILPTQYQALAYANCHYLVNVLAKWLII